VACKFWRLLILMLLEITREIPASTSAIMQMTRGVGTVYLTVTLYQAGFGGDVASELKLNAIVLTGCAHSFHVDFVWKLTSFDRMQNVVKMFAMNESALSIYLYHRLLG